MGEIIARNMLSGLEMLIKLLLLNLVGSSIIVSMMHGYKDIKNRIMLIKTE